MRRAQEWVKSYGSGVYGVIRVAKSGRTAEALAQAKRLRRGYGPNVPALAAAQVYGAPGDLDQAFESLERATDRHASPLFVARSDSLLSVLRRAARWERFVERMKFPERPLDAQAVHALTKASNMARRHATAGVTA